jgi:predicted benzoate:H+ symporter BenE
MARPHSLCSLCLALMFGLLAPRLLLASSKSLVTGLAGLAMLCVLQTVFITAFNESFSLGALLVFLHCRRWAIVEGRCGVLGLVAGVGISWPADS